MVAHENEEPIEVMFRPLATPTPPGLKDDPQID